MPHPSAPRAATALVLLAVAGAVLVIGAHLAITVRGTDRARVTFDSAEYAVAGREWARTGRIGTTFILPKEPRQPARPPFPLILGHPLVPALDALAFRLLGPRGDVTLLPAALAYLVLVVLAFRLATALGASTGAALVAAGAVAVAPTVLRYASEGLTEIPFAAVLTALVLVLAMEGPPRPLGFGILLGLGHLTRPVMVPLLPVALAAFAARTPRRSRLRATGLALASFLPFAGGLAAYKGAATGDPLADVSRYNLLAGLGPDLTPVLIQCMVDPPEIVPTLVAHSGQVAAKLGRAIPDLALGLFAPAGWLGPVAAIALAAGIAGRRTRVPATATLGLALVMIGVVALSLPSRRYLMPLLPLLLVAAIVALERAARALRVPAAAAWLVPALLALLTLGRDTAIVWRAALQHGVRDRGEFSESEWRRAGAQLASIVPPGTLIASDAGAFVAWYADRPAVLIPAHPGDLEVLGRRVEIGALALTNEWLLDQPGLEGWGPVVADPGAPGVLDGWRHAATIRTGRMRIVLLSRGPGTP